jgi:hypothetical protein
LNRGSKYEDNWDEYSSELEDDEEEYVDEDADEGTSTTTSSVAAISVTAVESSVSGEETNWVMGSDGYWWYHDKGTNEWWYKNTEGEIVQHK